MEDQRAAGEKAGVHHEVLPKDVKQRQEEDQAIFRPVTRVMHDRPGIGDHVAVA